MIWSLRPHPISKNTDIAPLPTKPRSTVHHNQKNKQQSPIPTPSLSFTSNQTHQHTINSNRCTGLIRLKNWFINIINNAGTSALLFSSWARFVTNIPRNVNAQSGYSIQSNRKRIRRHIRPNNSWPQTARRKKAIDRKFRFERRVKDNFCGSNKSSGHQFLFVFGDC